MASQDLADPAKTPLDLYALLGLPNPAANPSTPLPDTTAIKKAYRKASLRVHPDKAPEDKRDFYSLQFHRLTIAHDILTDDNLRAVYDARIEKERRQKAEREAFSKKRKQMLDDLARRESGGREGFLKEQSGTDGWTTPDKEQHAAGVKRTHEGRVATPLSEEQEREKVRLAAEGARRRAEFDERRKRRRSGLGSEETPVVGADGTPVEGTPSRSGGGAGGKSKMNMNGDNEGKSGGNAPSFSFSPAAAGKGPAKGKSLGLAQGQSSSAPGGSLFESTMAKLREAQRKKEEEKLRQQEAMNVQQAAS